MRTFRSIKNPFKKMLNASLNDKIADILRPLNISSILEVGEPEIGSKLKELKSIKSTEKSKLDKINKNNFKVNSFDLVIIHNLEKLPENKKIYKEALRITNKYILIITKINPFIVIDKNNNLTKLIKVRGIKIVTKKIIFPLFIILIKKS